MVVATNQNHNTNKISCESSQELRRESKKQLAQETSLEGGEFLVKI